MDDIFYQHKDVKLTLDVDRDVDRKLGLYQHL